VDFAVVIGSPRLDGLAVKPSRFGSDQLTSEHYRLIFSEPTSRQNAPAHDAITAAIDRRLCLAFFSEEECVV
jgi:hypothetical protein